MAIEGLNEYNGPITYGLRGNVGGENARWGINPATGKEEPYFGGYLLSDLMNKFGSIQAIHDYGQLQPGSPEWYAAQVRSQDDPTGTFADGPFGADIDRFSARPSNDTFSGKDGLRDLATIAAMAAPVVAGAAGAFGAAGATGTAGATAGTAAFEAPAAGSVAGTTASGAAPVGGGEGVVTGTSGAPMGDDWWTQYGLTAADVGETAASGDYWSQFGLSANDVGAGGTPAATTGSAFTSADLAQYGPLAARLAPSLLGAYASNKQTGALQGIADRFSEYGAPSRARYEASMTPGFDPTSIPGYQGAVDTASKSVLAKLSATGGNPFGNPGGLIDANKQIISGTALPAVQEYQRLNAGTGFGSTLNSAGTLGGQAINSNANIYNAVGAGINDVVNPPKSLAQQLAEYEKARKSIGGGANSLQ